MRVIEQHYLRIFAAAENEILMEEVNVEVEHTRLGAVVACVLGSLLVTSELLGVLSGWLEFLVLSLETVTEFLHSYNELLVDTLVCLLLPDEAWLLFYLRSELALVLLNLLMTECEHLGHLFLLLHESADDSACSIMLVQSLR